MKGWAAEPLLSLVGSAGFSQYPEVPLCRNCNVTLHQLPDLRACLRPVHWFKGMPSFVLRPEKAKSMLDEYPKEIVLKDGTSVVLRPLERDNADALIAFFQRVPADDRWYLRHDVTDPAVVRSWAAEINYERVIPIIALCEGRIVGDATLHRHRHGSSAHVGEVRLVIDPAVRAKRLGTWMILDILQLATRLGLEKLVAEIASKETAAIRALRHLDFVREAVIPELHRDAGGNPYDLLIMVKNLAPAWTDF